MKMKESNLVSITVATDIHCSKLAPGMSNIYHVNCCTSDYRDYKYDVEFVGDEMSFVVPIFGTFPRQSISKFLTQSMLNSFRSKTYIRLAGYN